MVETKQTWKPYRGRYHRRLIPARSNKLQQPLAMEVCLNGAHVSTKSLPTDEKNSYLNCH